MKDVEKESKSIFLEYWDRFKEGNKVFLCSDGVSDYATVDDLVDKVFALNWDKSGFNFAQAAGEFALGNNSKDNVIAGVWTASRMEFDGTADLESVFKFGIT